MVRMSVHFAKAVVSGFFLVIGCSVLIASENRYVGAVLFVVALCSICSLEIPLYTGAVGFVKTPKDFGNLAVTLLGNMTGCAVLGIPVGMALPEMSISAAAIVQAKIYPLHIAFILAFVCGILMYTAVYTYRTKNSYIGILTCVPVFIIAGFEHSVAYMGYMGLGLTVTADVLLNMLMFIAGNGIGAIAVNAIVQIGGKKSRASGKK